MSNVIMTDNVIFRCQIFNQSNSKLVMHGVINQIAYKCLGPFSSFEGSFQSNGSRWAVRAFSDVAMEAPWGPYLDSDTINIRYQYQYEISSLSDEQKLAKLGGLGRFGSKSFQCHQYSIRKQTPLQ